ncbi:hypothetical protein GETHLI_25960 [Geothrix limicola]|uniref:Methylated-DNA-[protein]-cysteine S-methyltransferase DNA binding domain-containing protein n=1 Tax=Geothrix limicola TaxID=2927978 RepID=A0ABQ5QGV2_9BACT|nr:MGMT family protein [Geothrix limicola]GLH74094.1 hypothetical protein GETHLI_25960 [Geothrix limicola]
MAKAKSMQPAEKNDPAPDFRTLVLAIVAKIPKGKLASYGQVAALAGFPQRPRQVGMVLSGLPEGTKLPWHRVVNTQGYVPSRGRWWGAFEQIGRLRDEGIEVDDKGNLDLEAHRWNGETKKPRTSTKNTKVGPRTRNKP